MDINSKSSSDPSRNLGSTHLTIPLFPIFVSSYISLAFYRCFGKQINPVACQMRKPDPGARQTHSTMRHSVATQPEARRPGRITEGHMVAVQFLIRPRIVGSHGPSVRKMSHVKGDPFSSLGQRFQKVKASHPVQRAMRVPLLLETPPL